ncbi:ionotropic receptor 93a-like [Daphnia pulex]|uniref:ionotropic receptor 93a-like n=1 Tax=Daphnia pulex TaxID=6669 RepID=UPI001EE00D4D|nr:ionotropic receptor 93a-like [Daphnia pulex]
MSFFFTLLIFIICFQIQNDPLVSSSHLNTLNGQHLQVIWPRWKGNPKGLTGPITGGIFLDTLADRLNFTYEMVRVTENRLEPQGKERGLFNYLWNQQSDLLVVGVTLSLARSEVVDLSVPWIFETYAFLIPVQDDTANINGVVKPFQWPVWLGLIVSVVCVTAALILVDRPFKKTRSANLIRDREHTAKRKSGRAGKQYLYVFGNLMSQSGPCTSKRLSFRLVAGVWTLAAFIFVQAYNSILFTYVVSPVNQPLINSVYDIIERNDVQLLTRKGSSMNILVSNPNATPIYIKLKKKLDTFPNSRCNLVSECINLITPGSRNTFVDGRSAHLETIKKKFEETKRCDLQLAKEPFLGGYASFALQKNSRYTDTINKGVLELLQTGIIDKWDRSFHPMPRQCMANGINSGKKRQETKNLSISLKNLTGAFVVYFVGFSLSCLTFLFELIISTAQR